MPPRSFLAVAIALSLVAACDAPRSPSDSADASAEPEGGGMESGGEASSGDTSGGDAETGDEDLATSGPGGWEAQSDPQGIVNGFIYDSDRDVYVEGLLACTGTLLRNDVVLTARHCVTTDATIAGPLRAPSTMLVTQDGPGATLGASQTVTAIVAMATEDVAMLRLAGNFSIEGRTTGESTQIYAEPQATVVGDNVLCQGYGLNSCTSNSGLGELRMGLMGISQSITDPTASNVGHLLYGVIMNGWLQWSGDSGSSCRTEPFAAPRFRKALGVQTKAVCAVVTSETGPDLYRDWAIEQMNSWAGDFSDDFSASFSYDEDAPASMVHGPPSWVTTGGVLTENTNAHTAGSTFEGSRYVHAEEVASDVQVSITVDSPDNDAAGLLLRYRDPTHYYRLAFDEQRRTARIVRREGNTWTTLAERTGFDIDWSSSPRLGFIAVGQYLVGVVDGAAVIASTGNFDYVAGRVGIYTWGLSGATFDDFEVERL